MKFNWIEQHKDDFPVTTMCRLLDVSRSGYYDWRHRPPSATSLRQAELVEHIQKAHDDSRQIYGSPRVHRALQAQGIDCCENTVARIMRKNKVKSIMRKRYRPQTTDSNHAQPIAPNLLDQQFKQPDKNHTWAGDITYVPTDEGWLYLAVVIDLYSRRVIGWSMADHLKASLAIDAFTMAVDQRCDEGADLSRLLHHSDRGVQYASTAYRVVLESRGITPSMSRRGNCYDNAMVESFFGSLKTELVHHERYETRQQAMQSIFEYIEVFYNRQRLHSSLGYVSPADYETA